MDNERFSEVIRHPMHRDLGVDAIASRDREGRLSMSVGERAINPAGMLHGGVIYLLCDVCAYAGLLSVLDS